MLLKRNQENRQNLIPTMLDESFQPETSMQLDDIGASKDTKAHIESNFIFADTLLLPAEFRFVIANIILFAIRLGSNLL